MTTKRKNNTTTQRHGGRSLLVAKIVLGILFFVPVMSWAQNPEVTMRFTNPVLDCQSNTYCLDVEYRADVPNREIFGTNARFFYNNDVMEFLDFRNFQGGYSLVAPLPTEEDASATATAFGFPAGTSIEYINGNVRLTNTAAAAVILPNDGSWAMLYQVCFELNPAQINDLSSFCPSVFWDLEQDPNNEGYQPASQGPVTSLVDPNNTGSSNPSDEMVEQFNWMYTGMGTAPPFGAPQSTSCLDASCFTPPPPPPPVTQNLPVLSPFYKFMLGLSMLGILVVVGVNQNRF